MCQADHPSRGVVPTVVYLSVIVKTRLRGGLGPVAVIAPWGGGGSVITLSETFFMSGLESDDRVQ